MIDQVWASNHEMCLSRQESWIRCVSSDHDYQPPHSGKKEIISLLAVITLLVALGLSAIATSACPRATTYTVINRNWNASSQLRKISSNPMDWGIVTPVLGNHPFHGSSQ